MKKKIDFEPPKLPIPKPPVPLLDYPALPTRITGWNHCRDAETKGAQTEYYDHIIYLQMGFSDEIHPAVPHCHALTVTDAIKLSCLLNELIADYRSRFTPPPDPVA